MSDTLKVQEFAKKGLKVINIFRSICLVCSIILSIVATLLLVLAISNQISGWITNDPNIVEKIMVTIKKDFGFIVVSDKVPLKELIESGKMNETLFQAAAEVSAAFVNTFIVFFLLMIIRKPFIKLEKATSPFSEELVVDVRNTFIVLSIMVLINSFFVGAIVSLVLACFYFMYKHGCKLQNEADETI